MMALRPLNPGIQNMGQFDGLDTQYDHILGGEVCTFVYVARGDATDVAVPDIDDGYVPTPGTRPAVTTTLVSGSRPLFLTDDGTTGYGTLFGQVVGAIGGWQVQGGSVLGPHTATGSGKITLWGNAGMYAVTVDAVDTTLNSGLVPTNPALTGGDPLYATAAGLLTPNVAVAFEAVVVARFIEFQTSQSLVTTTDRLVSALNSPAGQAAAPMRFTQVLIHFNPEV